MNLQHHFLIAMPSVKGGLFERSVVYVCEHTPEGAMGIVINKPVEDFSIEKVLQKIDIIPSPRDYSISLDDNIFEGGPMSDDRGFILHTPRLGFDSSIKISEQTMVTTSPDVLMTLGTPLQPNNVLVSLGYSSWSAGQLEEEILENSWLTVPADINVIFNIPVALRWQKAAALLGIDIATISPVAGYA